MPKTNARQFDAERTNNTDNMYVFWLWCFSCAAENRILCRVAVMLSRWNGEDNNATGESHENGIKMRQSESRTTRFYEWMPIQQKEKLPNKFSPFKWLGLYGRLEFVWVTYAERIMQLIYIIRMMVVHKGSVRWVSQAKWPMDRAIAPAMISQEPKLKLLRIPSHR